MKTIEIHRDRLERAFEKLLKHDLKKHNRLPVKIVLGSEAGIECSGDFWGMTAPGMGGWFQCPGRPCLLVNDAAILLECGSDVEAAMAVMNSVAIHELTHVLMTSRLCHDAVIAAPSAASVKRLLTTPSPVDDVEHVRETRQHGSDFIRVALHARHRLHAMGWRVPLAALLDWERFTSAHPEWYGDALKEDFKSHESRPLTMVVRTPPPKAFIELFDESLRTFAGLMTFLK